MVLKWERISARAFGTEPGECFSVGNKATDAKTAGPKGSVSRTPNVVRALKARDLHP